MFKEKDGIENPVVAAGVGLLPIIYACTTGLNALKFVGMLLVAVVFCVLLYEAFRPIVIENIRIPCYILIIFGVEYFLDSLTSELFMNGYSSIADSISYLLIATIIIYIFENIKKVESFGRVMIVSSFMSLRYVACGLIVGIVREILGKGSIFGLHFLGNGIELFNGYVGAMAVICVYAVVYGLLVVGRRKKYLAYNCLTDRYSKYLEDKFMEFVPYTEQDDLPTNEVGEQGDMVVSQENNNNQTSSEPSNQGAETGQNQEKPTQEANVPEEKDKPTEEKKPVEETASASEKAKSEKPAEKDAKEAVEVKEKKEAVEDKKETEDKGGKK